MIIHQLGTKTNFVDDNNVLVGFDTDQACCEHARWWISEIPGGGPETENDQEERGRDLTSYFFDPRVAVKQEIPGGRGDDGDFKVTFALISEHEPPLWLTLANAHNGYYGHGFHVDIGGKTIWEGVL